MSVIIPAWNEVEALPSCLGSVLASSYRDFEVIVVDNGSKDGTPELLASRFPQVRMLRNPENLGFGRALDQGSGIATGDLLLWLNADARLDPGWIESMVRALEARPEVGMATSVVTYEDEQDIVWSAGGWVDGLTGLAWDHGKGERIASVPPAADLDYVAACALLVRRVAFERTGGLDPDFFIYFEDADLGLRLKALGLSSVILDVPPIRHGALRRTGLRGAAGNKLFLFSRSNLRFILKDWTLARMPVAVLTWTLFYGAVAVTKGTGRYLPSVLRAAAWNLQHLEETKGSRRENPPIRMPPPRLGGLYRFLVRMAQHPELFPY